MNFTFLDRALGLFHLSELFNLVHIFVLKFINFIFSLSRRWQYLTWRLPVLVIPKCHMGQCIVSVNL